MENTTRCRLKVIIALLALVSIVGTLLMFVWVSILEDRRLRAPLHDGTLANLSKEEAVWLEDLRQQRLQSCKNLKHWNSPEDRTCLPYYTGVDLENMVRFQNEKKQKKIQQHKYQEQLKTLQKQREVLDKSTPSASKESEKP